VTPWRLNNRPSITAVRRPLEAPLLPTARGHLTLKYLTRTAAVLALLILCACARSQPVALSGSPTRTSDTACVIGGLGYPITSPVNRITADLRARGIKTVEAGPGDWPQVSFCDIIIGHSLGVDTAFEAVPGKRLIVAIDAFTRRQCPKGSTVVDIYNTNRSFPTTGPLACAQRTIAIDSGFGLAGHIHSPVTALPTVIEIVDKYLKASAHPAM
jgi:hypothetical protein